MWEERREGGKKKTYHGMEMVIIKQERSRMKTKEVCIVAGWGGNHLYSFGQLHLGRKVLYKEILTHCQLILFYQIQVLNRP
jgi:hypothetical protein